MKKQKIDVQALEVELERTKQALTTSLELRALEREELANVRAALKSVPAQIEDLKSRLLDAESERERMRGYILRVQEDDTVREELVAVGNENEQTLVPKRKPHRFNVLSEDRCRVGGYEGYKHPSERQQLPPKRWVNY